MGKIFIFLKEKIDGTIPKKTKGYKKTFGELTFEEKIIYQ